MGMEVKLGMWIGVEGLGDRLGVEVGAGNRDGGRGVSRKDQNYSGMFDASEMCYPRGHLVISPLLGALPAQPHPSQINGCLSTQETTSFGHTVQPNSVYDPETCHEVNVNLSCLQKPVSACWSPSAGLAGVVGCDWEGKRGGHACGTPCPLHPFVRGED